MDEVSGLKASLIAIMCIWGLCLSADAQRIPGYLGMRNMIATRVMGMPSLRDDASSINLQWGIEGRRILTRAISVGIKYGRLQTRVGYKSPISNFEGRAAIAGHSLGADVRWYNFFSLGNIAPIGPFQELELNYAWYNVSDISGRYFESPHNYKGKYMGTNQYFSLGFTVGYQRVMYKFITFQYGLKLGYMLPISLQTNSDEYVNDISTKRMRNYSAVMITSGLGVLIF